MKVRSSVTYYSSRYTKSWKDCLLKKFVDDLGVIGRSGDGLNPLGYIVDDDENITFPYEEGNGPM